MLNKFEMFQTIVSLIQLIYIHIEYRYHICLTKYRNKKIYNLQNEKESYIIILMGTNMLPLDIQLKLYKYRICLISYMKVVKR